VPHPHDFFAFGFEKTNPFPLSPSEKSKVVPAKKIKDFFGILTSTPY